MKGKRGFGCWICEDLSEPVTLAGGYRARLCQEHRNEWHKFIREHELIIEGQNIRVEGHIAAERLDEKQMKILVGETRKNEILLYAVGETWVSAAIISKAMDDRKKEE